LRRRFAATLNTWPGTTAVLSRAFVQDDAGDSSASSVHPFASVALTGSGVGLVFGHSQGGKLFYTAQGFTSAIRSLPESLSFSLTYAEAASHETHEWILCEIERHATELRKRSLVREDDRALVLGVRQVEEPGRNGLGSVSMPFDLLVLNLNRLVGPGDDDGVSACRGWGRPPIWYGGYRAPEQTNFRQEWLEIRVKILRRKDWRQKIRGQSIYRLRQCGWPPIGLES
jgi:hypothetical protein